MKLLAVSAGPHDANMSYYDGSTVRYTKIERTRQIKHVAFDGILDWKREIKSLWDLHVDEVNELVLNITTDNFEGANQIVVNNANELKFKDVIPNNWFINDNNVWYLNHHYCHTLSTWMLVDQEPDVSIVIDGIGDGYSWSVYRGDTLVDRSSIGDHSIGHCLEAAGEFLQIKAGSYLDISGKLMGLQSYGNVDATYLAYLQQYDLQSLETIFSYKTWFKYKGSDLIGHYSLLDWIATVHYRVGEILIDFFKKYAKPNELISYTGGVAQNVIWNTELRKHFPNLVIPPHCADDGLSLGALEWLRRKNNLPKFKLDNFPYVQSDESPFFAPSIETIKKTAEFLSQGLTVGWYQGHGEIGPRALGNRSILMNPQIANGKEKINSIKRRENYRPFGASILAEYSNEYFELAKDDFMLYTAKVKTDKLTAITHVDGTCRVQTVTDKTPVFKSLLEEFYQLTNCPVLLNTSMNLAGKPIAGYIDNAKELFYTSKLDVLVVGNEIFTKGNENVTRIN
jgi:carbamoyltransferase